MALNEVVENVFDQAMQDLRKSSQKAKYRTDPALWAKEVLGIHLWSKQREIAEALRDNKRTAVKSCHNAGKSKLAAILACWWIATHPVGSAIVITTAPTYQQVHGIIWREIAKHHQLSKDNGQSLPGYITQADKWNINTPEGNFQAGWGRKPADSNIHGFQGVHERYVLVIVDEACGINESLWTAIEAITTTGDARILAIGNPDDPNTQFGKIFNDANTKSEWTHITVSAFETPNLTKPFENDPTSPYYARAQLDKDFPDDLRPLMLQPETVESWRNQWGEQDPRWKAKILGEFPDQSENSLFSQGVINKAVETVVVPDHDGRPTLGVDVARFGNDMSTVYSMEEGYVYNVDDDGKQTRTERRGKQIRLVEEWSMADAVETAKKIHHHALGLAAKEVRIDVSGYGAGVKDQVVLLAQTTYSVVGMNGSSATPDPYKWKNGRAWWHDMLREQMASGTIDIEYGDEKLKNELLGIRYHFKNNYRSLQVESKDDMASRGVKSPDHSDAVVYAAAPLDDLLNSPLAYFNIGDRISMDTATILGTEGQRFALLGPF